MAGNTIGKNFTLTTFGESHGVALGGIIDGIPPNFAINFSQIQEELNRRKPAGSAFTSPRKETDEVEFLSGVFNGLTTGTPIGFIIRNQDQRSQDYAEIKHKFRPNHGDLVYKHKYGIRDYRGGGRASARETAIRVVAGAIAKQYLAKALNVEIYGFLAQMGEITPTVNWEEMEANHWEFISQNPFFAPNAEAVSQYEQLIHSLMEQGDSVGGKVQVVVRNLPAGLGEPVFDKLNADLAYALMSINAVKAVEIGDGVAVANQRGSQARDEITTQGFTANHAGGILAGISTGQDLIASISLKPTSSIKIPARTLNDEGEECEISVKGRHDPCVAIRAVPVAEAMVAIILLDHWLRFKGQCL